MLEGLGGVTAMAQQGDYYNANTKMARMPTMAERLDLAVSEAEKKLAAVKEAREIFQRNPDIERLLDIMQTSHF